MIKATDARQADMFAGTPTDDQSQDPLPDRAIIDQLIADTRLYSTAASQRELAKFIATFPRIAPFNAMLLHIQKPGITFVASPSEWRDLYKREIKPDSRPLVILWPFGPVSFVYDIQDTVGPDLPEGVLSFPALGKVPENWLLTSRSRMRGKNIPLDLVDTGDARAGYIERKVTTVGKKRDITYRVVVNKNHSAASQVTTLAHELAHLVLGHLGADFKLGIKDGRRGHALSEVEAESVAYLVAIRSGLAPRSDQYLADYKGEFENLDMHRITQAAGAVERLLGMPFLKPKAKMK